MKRLAFLLCLLPMLAQAQRYCNDSTGVKLGEITRFSYPSGQTVQWMMVRLDFVDAQPITYLGLLSGDLTHRVVALPNGITLTISNDKLTTRGAVSNITLPRCKE